MSQASVVQLNLGGDGLDFRSYFPSGGAEVHHCKCGFEGVRRTSVREYRGSTSEKVRSEVRVLRA